MRFAYVVPAVVFATQVCALNFLETRQFEAFADLVPEQCQSSCDPIISTLNTCSPSDIACSCTPSAMSELEICGDCLREFVGEAGGDAAIDAFDQQVDPLMEWYRDTCASINAPTVVRPTPSGRADSGDNDSDNKNDDPLGGLGGGAPPLALSLGGAAAVAAGVLFLL
ncbi:hypothetical protein BKA70DRAFT_1293509 [Coprinopsis sp. MPI-PUGE-AT-0042]|nr:hypothetical protein BKA70DRAFT_1293509 [Coprinopsis sp. MPI-PUGE-AT-0042]